MISLRIYNQSTSSLTSNVICLFYMNKNTFGIQLIDLRTMNLIPYLFSCQGFCPECYCYDLLSTWILICIPKNSFYHTDRYKKTNISNFVDWINDTITSCDRFLCNFVTNHYVKYTLHRVPQSFLARNILYLSYTEIWLKFQLKYV